jgi:hypothetical protein
MKKRLPLLLSFVFLSCFCQSQKLKVAFTEIGTLDIPTKVYVGNKMIGQATQLIPTENADTIFAVINLSKGMKVPTGSKFYIEERVLTNSVIKIEFSKEKTYLTSKDMIQGSFKPIPIQKTIPADSSKTFFKEKFRI